MYVAHPPDGKTLFKTMTRNRLAAILEAGPPASGSGYIHWDKLRHLEPPDGLTREEWWLGIKLARAPALRPLSLSDAAGERFVYSTPDAVLRLLHYVDQRCSGEIAMAEVVTADEHARRRYLVNSLMEEAIRSSQLEGASTSRQVAKELLSSGREPIDRSERMILNNFRALEFMREGIGNTLTPAAVLELQRVLTEGTLDDPTAAGRLQTPGEDRVAVVDRLDGSLIHSPPPAEQLPARLRAMCDFANESHERAEPFVHPVVRGILLHFWLAYDHPFADGNGRTARALFYWYMRTRGYWLVEYLSISRILRKAPAQYGRSFVLTETDDRDTTYFLLYQLEVIERAVKELHEYLQRKIGEIRDVEDLIKDSAEFNHRQLALLSDAVRHPEREYTLQAHAGRHAVTHETARNDLGQLLRRGLLERHRSGRKHVFRPVADLPELLRGLS